jgi:hypothetical protein
VANSIDMNSTAQGGPPLYGFLGNFTSITVNVTTADTSTNSVILVGPGFIPIINQSTGVETGLSGGNNTINLKTTGTRIINANTTSGALAGDTLTAPGLNSWAASTGTQISVTADESTTPAGQCPVFTLTAQATR